MSGEPICTLVVFCDLVIVEQNTGKNTLVGTFPALVSATFPLAYQQLFVHVSISNFVDDEAPCTVVVNLKQNHSGAVIGSAAIPIKLPNRPQDKNWTFNVNIPFRNIIFHTPGPYVCEILLDGAVIGSRILEIRQHLPNQDKPTLPPAAPQGS